MLTLKGNMRNLPRLEVNEIIYINIITLSLSLLSSLTTRTRSLESQVWRHQDSRYAHYVCRAVDHIIIEIRTRNVLGTFDIGGESSISSRDVSRRIHADRKTSNPNKYNEEGEGNSRRNPQVSWRDRSPREEASWVLARHEIQWIRARTVFLLLLYPFLPFLLLLSSPALLL